MEKIATASQEAPPEPPCPSLEEVRAAQEGDPEALTTVLAFTLEYALKILSPNCSDVDAQGIVSDVVERVFKGLANFQGSSKFSTWLTTIVYNSRNSYFRKAHRHNEQPTTNEALGTVHSTGHQDPEQTAVREIYGQGLFAIAQKVLDDDEYTILKLKIIDNMRHQDIAEKLGITEAASKTRLHRVIQKLYNSPTFNKHLTPS